MLSDPLSTRVKALHPSRNLNKLGQSVVEGNRILVNIETQKFAIADVLIEGGQTEDFERQGWVFSSLIYFQPLVS